MYIRRVLPLIVILFALLILMVLVASRANAHNDECLATTQLLQSWEEEADVGLTEELLQSLRSHLLRWDEEDCADGEGSVYSQDGGSPAYRGIGTGPIEEWRPLVAGHFESEDVETALCLISYESGGNPDAKNPTSSARGLMQVLASLWAPHFGISYSDLYIPEINLYISRKIKDIQGWYAWSPYNRGLCRGL